MYGFDILAGGQGEDIEEYAALTEAWRARIAARRIAVVAAMINLGWLLSRDSLEVITPTSGRRVVISELQALIS